MRLSGIAVTARIVVIFSILEVAGQVTGLDLNFEDRLTPSFGNLRGVDPGQPGDRH